MSPEIACHRVRIRNARLLGHLSLDEQGVELVHCGTADAAVDDFYDADQVRERYYPEVETLVSKATGAARVLVFDQDDAGQRAVAAALEVMPGAKVAKLPAKDANECLIEGLSAELVEAVLNA